MAARVNKNKKQSEPDICVIGGGIAGLACAAFVKQLSPQTTVRILERADINAAEDDGKSVVFNDQSAKWLAEAGAWDENARPLHRVHAGFAGRSGAFDIAGELPLGHGASHLRVRQLLAEKLKNELVAPAQVLSCEDGKTEYQFKNKKESARPTMTVFACEAPFLPSAFRAREYNYRQAAITFAASAQTPPGDCAWEQFTPRGVVALVPRADENAPVGVVICAPTSRANEVSALSDEEMSQWLNNVFNNRFGLQATGKRATYAPRLRHIYPLASGATACIGAGATQLHPAGAQGLNLGIHDARAFAECWRDAKDENKNKAAAVSNAYRNRRRAAHITMITATSALALMARLTSIPPLAMLGATMAEGISRIINTPPLRTPAADILSGRR